MVSQNNGMGTCGRFAEATADSDSPDCLETATCWNFSSAFAVRERTAEVKEKEKEKEEEEAGKFYAPAIRRPDTPRDRIVTNQ